MYAVLANTVKVRRDRTGARAGLVTARKGCMRNEAAIAAVGDLEWIDLCY